LADELLGKLQWKSSAVSMARLVRMHGAPQPPSMVQLHEDGEFVSALKQVGLVGKQALDLFTQED